MARRRLTGAAAATAGADIKNPHRFKGRKAGRGVPLGDPSSWMGADQRTAWAAFKSECPWLCESDRSLVEIAATLRARLNGSQEFGVQAANLLRLCIGQMGATPTDRSKIPTIDDDEDDPDEVFFRS